MIDAPHTLALAHAHASIGFACASLGDVLTALGHATLTVAQAGALAASGAVDAGAGAVGDAPVAGTMRLIEPSPWDLAIAAALLLVNALISIVFRLKLEGQIVLGVVRTTLQLTAVGFILKGLFEYIHNEEAWPLAIALLVVMNIIAGQASLKRVKRRFHGIKRLATMTIMTSNLLLTAIACFVILRVWEKPGGVWYDPQYLIPIGGMLLHNTLNGISLGLDRLLDGLSAHRARIDLLIAHGATGAEASREVVRDAMRAAMTPMLNSMMVIGIVSLPGMMTGQILAGVDPVVAVSYQIMIMFLIASCTAMGATLAVLITRARLFDDAHRLRLERTWLAKRPKSRPKPKR